MIIQKLPFSGWENNLFISNGQIELVVTLDVGPRVLSYRTLNGKNVFKIYEDHAGGSGETEWMNRGGHRLWTAPEPDRQEDYELDNGPVKHTLLPNGVCVENDPQAPSHVRKYLTVTLGEDSSEVTVHHRVVNEGTQPIELATWGLSVMAPGGLEIIPQPPLGEHPRDLLPNRTLVLWPYTDMTDPRYRFGWSFITLRQTKDGAPTKLGLAHKSKWVAYLNQETLFIKTFAYEAGETYPDGGCNFETFSDRDMLEVETLSPLRNLQPGESVEHTEKWYLFSNVVQPVSLHEEDIATWVEPFLTQIGL